MSKARVEGELRRFERRELDIATYSHQTDAAEWERFLSAKERLAARLDSEIQEGVNSGSLQAEIIASHKWVLEDQLLNDKIEKLIDSGRPALLAVNEAKSFLQEQLVQAEEEYVRERQYDVEDVLNRLMHELQDQPAMPPSYNAGEYIFISERFLPSEVIALYKGNAKGLLCKEDSPFSHSAIIAQSLGLPYVVQLKDGFNHLIEGMKVIIDGENKIVIIDRKSAGDEHPATAGIPTEERVSLTNAYRDNHPELRLTLSSLKEIETAAAIRSENVGLIRSEFLFLDRDVRLDVSAQERVYKSIFAMLKDREVIIRTFDYRGEKQAATVRKDNVVDRDLTLKFQLEALYRASSSKRLKIMFPLVLDLIQAEKCLRIARNVKHELLLKGLANLNLVELGAMIETRDSIKKIPMIAPLFSFIALGTNDILESIAHQRRDQLEKRKDDALLYRELRELIRQAASACKRLSIPMGICGLYAEDPDNHDFFKEIGVSYVSVSFEALGNGDK